MAAGVEDVSCGVCGVSSADWITVCARRKRVAHPPGSRSDTLGMWKSCEAPGLPWASGGSVGTLMCDRERGNVNEGGTSEAEGEREDCGWRKAGFTQSHARLSVRLLLCELVDVCCKSSCVTSEISDIM